MNRNLLGRNFMGFALAAALLAPSAAFAQAPPVPPPPPAAPPARPRPNDRVHGKITAVDAAKKTVTLSQHKTLTTLAVPDTAKIYKIGDTRRAPTGAFSDLTVGAQVVARITGDLSAPTAVEVHLRVPKADKPKAAPLPIPAQ